MIVGAAVLKKLLAAGLTAAQIAALPFTADHLAAITAGGHVLKLVGSPMDKFSLDVLQRALRTVSPAELAAAHPVAQAQQPVIAAAAQKQAAAAVVTAKTKK